MPIFLLKNPVETTRKNLPVSLEKEELLDLFITEISSILKKISRFFIHYIFLIRSINVSNCDFVT